jgi:hypothetical protein
VVDVNPLSLRYHLADIERAARARPRAVRRTRPDLASRAIETARRLVLSIRARETERA